MNEDPTYFAKNNYSRLRVYQFRLRSLFVLMLLVAVGLSGLLTIRNVQRRQWDATVPILKAGGKVSYKQTALGKLLGDRSFVTVYVVKFTNKSVRNVDLSRLQALKQLECLRLDNTDVCDADLAFIQGLNQLFELGLNNTNVGDTGLEHLKEMKGLFLLVLSNTKISDVGLKHISALPHLCKLDLRETNVTDAGLEHLKKLRQLSLLNLAYTDVGDDGLSHIRVLTQLSNLDLNSPLNKSLFAFSHGQGEHGRRRGLVAREFREPTSHWLWSS